MLIFWPRAYFRHFSNAGTVSNHSVGSNNGLIHSPYAPPPHYYAFIYTQKLLTLLPATESDDVPTIPERPVHVDEVHLQQSHCAHCSQHLPTIGRTIRWYVSYPWGKTLIFPLQFQLQLRKIWCFL